MFKKVFKSKSIGTVVKRCLHLKETNVGVLGVPFDKGQNKPGTSKGPEALRNGGLVEKLRSLREL